MKISETRFCVIDVETTGLDATKDKLCEFAMLDSRGFAVDFLIDPGIFIPHEVSAIHHLTNEDLEGALPHDEALTRIERLVIPSYVVVAHNAPFDRSFLPCLDGRRWLDTKRLAKHLLPNADSHSNQALRYRMGGAKIDLRGQVPHRAAADVIVTKFVLEKLLEMYFDDELPDDLESLLSLAESPVKLPKMPLGKHRGAAISDVPSDYISWAIGPKGMVDMDSDLRFTLESELKSR